MHIKRHFQNYNTWKVVKIPTTTLIVTNQNTKVVYCSGWMWKDSEIKI